LAFLVVLFAISNVSIPTATAQIARKQTLKESLARYITTPPDTVQFAKDKKYEEAWIIKNEAARPSPAECRKYLNKEKFNVLVLE